MKLSALPIKSLMLPPILIPLCFRKYFFFPFFPCLGLYNPPRNTFILFNMPGIEEAFVKSFHLLKHHSLNWDLPSQTRC